MLMLLRCVLLIGLLLLQFLIWGNSIALKLHITVKNLPMQMLVGFFSYFIVAEVIIIPVIFLKNSLFLASVLAFGISVIVTIVMLCINKLSFLCNIKKIRITLIFVFTLCVVCFVAILAVLQPYMGYDTTYYIGEVNSFLYYGKFWTRDAFTGMTETDAIPLHYALSCFYPLWAILACIFHVDARVMMMFTVRALCVILFACVAYCWGYNFFNKKNDNTSERICHRKGLVFVIICMLLGMFLMDGHSAFAMMMVRGYESKGYCAAVVAPMSTYALVMLCRDVDSQSNWRLLGLVAWSSMPIAMSSMAVIPVAIAIVGLALMVYHKRVWSVFWRCFVCVIPNMFLMAWYILGSYMPRLKG